MCLLISFLYFVHSMRVNFIASVTGLIHRKRNAGKNIRKCNEPECNPCNYRRSLPLSLKTRRKGFILDGGKERTMFLVINAVSRSTLSFSTCLFFSDQFLKDSRFALSFLYTVSDIEVWFCTDFPCWVFPLRKQLALLITNIALLYLFYVLLSSHSREKDIFTFNTG